MRVLRINPQADYENAIGVSRFILPCLLLPLHELRAMEDGLPLRVKSNGWGKKILPLAKFEHFAWGSDANGCLYDPAPPANVDTQTAN